MAFDFDTEHDRHGTGSEKWEKYGRDVLPMWVADMDFRSPPAVIDALQRRVAHGIFGYTRPTESQLEAVIEHLLCDFGWRVRPEWIVWLPGLVTGLHLACRSMADEGDGVLTALPIYPPFRSAPVLSGRNLIEVPLARDGDTWRWDLEAAACAVTPRCRLLMLCNPHNPVGRVFSREELAAIAGFCERHDLIVCSDEIHAGLVLDDDKKHVPIASLDQAVANRTITLMAPSKTYNLPGIGCGFAVIAEPSLRARFAAAMRGIVPHVNALGYVATEAAYRHGGPWRQALIGVLRSNRDRLLGALSSLPGLQVFPVEATSLAWIDARGLGRSDPHGFFLKAGVGLSDGGDFGAPGFLRLNFGCPQSMLDRALRRVEQAVRHSGATPQS